VDYASAKLKLSQSWHYKILAIIKRHKKHLSLSCLFIKLKRYLGFKNFKTFIRLKKSTVNYFITN